MWVDLKHFWDYPSQLIPVSSTFLTIDAVNEKAAYIFRAPKTGNIDRVSVAFRSVITPGNLDVRLETVSEANGAPSGNLVSVGASTQVAVLAGWANTIKEIVLDTPAAVIKGQVIAVVVSLPGAGNMQIQKRPAGPAGIHSSQGTTYSAIFTTVWALDSNQPCGFVRYDDGSYPYINDRVPWHTGQNVFISSSSTPDEMGNRFVLPFTCKVAGLWIAGTKVANSSCELRLYDEADAVLKSQNLDVDQVVSSSVSWPQLFSDSVVLEKGEVYRGTALGTGTGAFGLNEATTLTAEIMDAAAGGSLIHQTRRAGSSWDDFPDVRTALGLLIEAIDLPGEFNFGGIA